MKKAWDPSAAPAIQPPSFDGVVLSHNESDELMDEGLRPLTASKAAELKDSLTQQDSDAIHERDLGFGRKIWVCPITLLERDTKHPTQPHRAPSHLRLAHS